MRRSAETLRKPKFAVVRFPGSNCDQDAFFTIRNIMGCPVEYVWHEAQTLRGFDIVVLPGGFSYGDYLRTGAVARFAPVMNAVKKHASKGKLVMGICNGFQILCEAHLLPGALMQNINCKFVCKFVTLQVENASAPFTCSYRAGQKIRIPIAHGEGRYICDEDTLNNMIASKQILFRYSGAEGNPNGSISDIAGIANDKFNVMGMMPHPERACEKILGSADGRGVFTSLIQSAIERA